MTGDVQRDLAEALAESARERREPAGLSTALRVLWLAAAGDWTAAHDLAQDMDDRIGARLHAYLHRVEDDQENAGYWYDRAGEPPFAGSLAEEWRALVARCARDARGA